MLLTNVIYLLCASYMYPNIDRVLEFVSCSYVISTLDSHMFIWSASHNFVQVHVKDLYLHNKIISCHVHRDDNNE